MQSLNYLLHSVYHSDESLKVARIQCVKCSNITHTVGLIAWLLQPSSDILCFIVGMHEVWFHLQRLWFLTSPAACKFLIDQGQKYTNRVLGPTNFGVGAEVEKEFSYSKTSVTTVLGKCSEALMALKQRITECRNKNGVFFYTNGFEHYKNSLPFVFTNVMSFH